MDVIHRNEVPLHKVNWGAKQEYEFVNNFKILQSLFDKYNIKKVIEVMLNIYISWFKISKILYEIVKLINKTSNY